MHDFVTDLLEIRRRCQCIGSGLVSNLVPYRGLNLITIMIDHHPRQIGRNRVTKSRV